MAQNKFEARYIIRRACSVIKFYDMTNYIKVSDRKTKLMLQLYL